TSVGDGARARGPSTVRHCVRSRLVGRATIDESDLRWSETVRAGGTFNDEIPSPPVSLRDVSSVLNGLVLGDVPAGDAFTLVVSPSTHLYDGRSANEPWLQETPDPVASTVWHG